MTQTRTFNAPRHFLPTGADILDMDYTIAAGIGNWQDVSCGGGHTRKRWFEQPVSLGIWTADSKLEVTRKLLALIWAIAFWSFLQAFMLRSKIVFAYSCRSHSPWPLSHGGFGAVPLCGLACCSGRFCASPRPHPTIKTRQSLPHCSVMREMRKNTTLWKGNHVKIQAPEVYCWTVDPKNPENSQQTCQSFYVSFSFSSSLSLDSYCSVPFSQSRAEEGRGQRG